MSKNMSKLIITALAGESGKNDELKIAGIIGEYDYWSDTYKNTDEEFASKLNTLTSPEIDVYINSEGGNVVMGLAMYNAMKRHPSKINIFIEGVAMSAAADAAMAGDTITMCANGLMMLHGASTFAGGNAEDHRATADMLEKWNSARATNYAEKTGRPIDEILAILNSSNDHFYTAAEALQNGFIDKIGLSSSFVTAQLRQQIQARYRQAPTAWFTQPTGKQTMSDPTKDSPEPETKPKVEGNQPPNAENLRIQGIEAVFELVSNKPERSHIHAMKETMLLDTSITPEKARELILAELGKGQEPAGQRSVHVEAGKTGKEKFIEAASDALLLRAGFKAPTASVNNDMRGWRVERIAEQCLINASLAVSGDRMQMVAAAFTQSTSDFPNILENAMHKTLLMGYENAETTWRKFCKIGTVSDFREHSRYRKGTFGLLDKKTELGEFKTKAIPDGEKAKVTAGTKGNIIYLSREMIINDDLGAFLDIANELGMTVNDTIEDDVFTLLLANPVMADGNALFSTAHKNLGTAGAASITSISEGRKKMLSHKKIGTDAKMGFLRIMPKIFLGGFTQADNARVVNTSKMDPDATNQLGRENIRQGTFSEVIDTPYFEDNQWYMFADPARFPVLEVAFLNGVQTPYIELQNGFTVDGAAYKVRIDYGTDAVDWRGGVKNAGS